MEIEYLSLIIGGVSAIVGVIGLGLAYRQHRDKKTSDDSGTELVIENSQIAQGTGNIVARTVNITTASEIPSRGRVLDAKSPSAIPLQRPPKVDRFLGRDEDLRKLLEDLQPGKKVSICGPGGIGKTNLATKAIWELFPGSESPDRFPDGIVYHTFYGQPSSDLAFEHLARAFGVEPNPSAHDAAFVALSGKNALLFLDGTEQAESLDKVLEVVGGCGVLITSRSRGDAPDPAERNDLTPFSKEASVGLLKELAEDLIDDQDAAAEAAGMVGYLPLAINLVGRFLSRSDLTISKYLPLLQKSPLAAPGLNEDQKRMKSVPWLLKGCVAQVGQEAKRALALSGQLAFHPYREDMVGQVLGISSDACVKAVSELIDYGLAIRTDDRVRLHHALVYQYVRDEMGLPEDDFNSLVTFFEHHVREQSEMGAVGYEMLHPDRPHAMQLVSSCVEREDWVLAERLARALVEYLSRQGFSADQVLVVNAGLASAQHLADKEEQSGWLTERGHLFSRLGDLDGAVEMYEKSLAIETELGRKEGMASDYGNLGIVYKTRGDLDTAREVWELALDLFSEIGSPNADRVRSWLAEL